MLTYTRRYLKDKPCPVCQSTNTDTTLIPNIIYITSPSGGYDIYEMGKDTQAVCNDCDNIYEWEAEINSETGDYEIVPVRINKRLDLSDRPD